MKSESRLGALAVLFLKVGNLTFGGGDPTMAALHREMVGRRGWLTQDQYGLAYGLARATPGTNLLAFCAGVAWQVCGWLGALAAVIVVTVPSSAFVVWLTFAYERLKDNPAAAGVIAGTLAAAAGMMFGAGFHLVRAGLKGGNALRTLILFGAALALLLGRFLSPIPVLALAALGGALWRERE